MTATGTHRFARRFLALGLVAAMLALTALFHALQPKPAELQMLGSGDDARVLISANRRGQYVADGAIDGQPVRFLVDTGADTVAVPRPMADALGLDFGPQIQVQTAGGPSRGWLTRIDSVRIGHLERRNVGATITEADMDAVLLGMSFLRHFRIQQEAGTLQISRAHGGSS